MTQVRQDHKFKLHSVLAFCWDGNKATLNDAVQKLEQMCNDNGLEMPANPRREIQKYRDRMQTEGNIASHSHLAGRHSIMPDEDVLFIGQKIDNYKEAGEIMPYPSLQVLSDKVPEVAAVIDKAGVEHAAVLKRLHKLRPDLKHVKLTVKKVLTKDTRKDRVTSAKKRKRVTKRQQRAYVFIDAKSMRMEIDKAYGWISTDRESDIVELQHAKSHSSKVPTLNYYIAVGYYVGALDIMYYTGTTGLKAERDGITFKVR